MKGELDDCVWQPYFKFLNSRPCLSMSWMVRDVALARRIAVRLRTKPNTNGLIDYIVNVRPPMWGQYQDTSHW